MPDCSRSVSPNRLNLHDARLKPLFVQAKPQADSTAIKSATPSANATGSQPSATTLHITPNAGVVQAIDDPSDALPAGYQSETFTAADLGTAGGFSIGMPSNWHVDNEMGHRISLDAPDGTTYVELDLTADTERTMVGEARYLRSQHEYPDYQSKNAVLARNPSSARSARSGGSTGARLPARCGWTSCCSPWDRSSTRSTPKGWPGRATPTGTITSSRSSPRCCVRSNRCLTDRPAAHLAE